MKSCKKCRHAEWKRTVSGRQHPSGDGRCAKIISIPALPAAYCWTSVPAPFGGYINRKESLKEHCPYFEWAPDEGVSDDGRAAK